MGESEQKARVTFLSVLSFILGYFLNAQFILLFPDDVFDNFHFVLQLVIGLGGFAISMTLSFILLDWIAEKLHWIVKKNPFNNIINLFNRYIKFLGFSNEGIRRIFILILFAGSVSYICGYVFMEFDHFSYTSSYISMEQASVDKSGTQDSIKWWSKRKPEFLIEQKENRREYLLFFFIFVPTVFITFSLTIKFTMKTIIWIFEGFVKKKELNK